jgi:hypothetical protein
MTKLVFLLGFLVGRVHFRARREKWHGLMSNGLIRPPARRSEDTQSKSEILPELGLQSTNGVAPAGLELFSETMQRLVSRGG